MRYSCLLYLLLLPLLGVAQASDTYYFRHYTNRSGLSHNTVYCSLQDQRGFMWFGTDDGLNRFDGYQFTVYRYNARGTSEQGLPNDRVINLFEDSTGKIWICTWGGTCYYDFESDSFIPLKLFSDQTDSFDEVLEDANHHLWFRERSRIVKSNLANRELKVYSADEYGFHSQAMVMTEEGYPLFASVSSLYMYQPDTDQFTRLPVLTDQEVSNQESIETICQIPQIGVLVGTNKGGLKLYHASSGRVETVIPDIHVRSILPVHANLYWIASESGIYMYNLVDKSVVNLRKSLTNDFALSDNAVYSLTKDQEGGIWAGTFFGGINYLPKNHAQFKYYIGGKTHAGMLGNTVREICPDQYGNLWLSTEDNGINRYNPRTNQMTNYSVKEQLSATNIHGLYADGDSLWIGTFHKGIDVMHIPTEKIIARFTQSNTHAGLSDDFVLCFYKTRQGHFLIGTASGVLVYERQTNRFYPWKGITDGLVRQFHEDRRGNIWIATTSGVYKYKPAGNGDEEKVVCYTTPDKPGRQGLGSNSITSVFEDSKGRIWVTTAYGFSLYHEVTNTFNRITTDDGLPSNFIYRIVEDEESQFWVSTANGLVKFNPETHVMHTYTHTDGLHETQFNYSSSYRAPDGTIFMGTINGMISFHPKQFRKETYTPPLYFTRIHVAGSDSYDVQIGALSSGEPYQLKLPHNHSSLTIAYIAPNYTSPDAIRYAYILGGSDADWVDMGNNREVTFARLSPGKYTFKIRSTNSNGEWQANEKVLQIHIAPPFWSTGWAYLLYFILLVGCLAAFFKYKQAQLEKKHQQKRAYFETEKEKELYQAKIQFFTFITHEIRTPLTLIKAPLEKIIQSGDGSSSTRRNLQIIDQNTERLLELSNQLLDFRKAESKGFRLHFVKTNVTALLQNLIHPFDPVFQQEAKEVTVTFPEQYVFAYVDQEALAKIISNLMTNAVKYSSRRIAVELSRNESGSAFQFCIRNDGFLIPKSEREHIFTPFYRVQETQSKQGSGIGLSLVRTLAEFHNGTLAYQATPDGLNEFLLTLPIEQEGLCFDNLPGVPDEAEAVMPAPSGKPILLIVEDQPDMRQFIADELASAYDIREAENGKAAMQLLELQEVNLIISDIMMPLMDGFELCNQVKNDVRYCHIPLILLTAQHNEQSRLKGLNKGADAYLEKPFTLDILNAQISNLLRNRELLYASYVEKPQTLPSSLAHSSLDDIFLQKLSEFLRENLTNESLNVQMIADEMGMSSSSLYRKVKGLSSLSPVDFIRISRLKKAVELMEGGEYRISEIAFLTGFSSPAYFSTCFQKQYGKSPSEFMGKSQ